MKKAFIDLGAYRGDTVKEFFNWGTLIDDPHSYQIYAFEPNPDLHDQMIRISKKDFDNVIFKPWAAWTYTGEIEIAIDKTRTPMGSTIMPTKVDIWDHHPKKMVKCFDFSQWLLDNFILGDEVIVKMDIEGAEFEVLEKMIKDNSIAIPSYLFVEFHPNKVRNYTTDDTNRLVDRIIENGGNLKLWH